MSDKQIDRFIACLLKIREYTGHKISMDLMLQYLYTASEGERSFVDVMDWMDWSDVKVSRDISSLGELRYQGKGYNTGYQLLYTEEHPTNRAMKNIFLTDKGKKLKKELKKILDAK